MLYIEWIFDGVRACNFKCVFLAFAHQPPPPPRIHFLNQKSHISMQHVRLCKRERASTQVCSFTSRASFAKLQVFGIIQNSAHTFTHVPLPPISNVFALQCIEHFVLSRFLPWFLEGAGWYRNAQTYLRKLMSVVLQRRSTLQVLHNSHNNNNHMYINSSSSSSSKLKNRAATMWLW